MLELLRLLCSYSRPLVFVASVAGIVGGACNALLLMTIHAAWKGNLGRLSLIAAFVTLCAMMVITRVSASILLNNVATEAVMQMRLELLDQLLKTPLRHIEQIGGERILNCMTSDPGTIIDTMPIFPHICWNGALILTCFSYLAWLSRPLFAVVFVVVVASSISYRLFMKRAIHQFLLTRMEWDRLFEQFRASTAGVKELQLHSGRRRGFCKDVYECSERHRNYSRGSVVLHSIGVSGHQTIMYALLGTLVFVAPAAHVSPGTVVAYVIVLLYVMRGALDAVLEEIPNLARAGVAIQRIRDLGLALRSDKRVIPETPPQPNPDWKSLDLVAVTHTYHGESDLESFKLGPVDLMLRPGEILFISGGNGSGKSTLAKVITGLYLPQDGELRIDGVPISNGKIEGYREQFSAIFSDFYLFSRLFGLEADEQVQVPQYLTELQLDKKVTIRDGAFSTINLSQGQRRRLALLVAFLEDRPIYLFDEWASDQDPPFKDLFYNRILPRLRARGKTVVVISHDDRYYHIADRRVHLENGSVAFVRVRSDKKTSDKVI